MAVSRYPGDLYIHRGAWCEIPLVLQSLQYREEGSCRGEGGGYNAEPNGIRGVRRKKVQKNDLPVAEGGNRHADQR